MVGLKSQLLYCETEILFFVHIILCIQVNKKFCELKRGNIGIAEKAQETRSGTSHKHSKYDLVMESKKSCFVSYVIVKSPSKPYIVVHLAYYYSSVM